MSPECISLEPQQRSDRHEEIPVAPEEASRHSIGALLICVPLTRPAHPLPSYGRGHPLLTPPTYNVLMISLGQLQLSGSESVANEGYKSPAPLHQNMRISLSRAPCKVRLRLDFWNPSLSSSFSRPCLLPSLRKSGAQEPLSLALLPGKLISTLPVMDVGKF